MIKDIEMLGPVDQELLSIMPQNDAVGEVHDKCAVVGSSGILLNYENGKFIDEHDAVFGFNSAPTKGGLKHTPDRKPRIELRTPKIGHSEKGKSCC